MIDRILVSVCKFNVDTTCQVDFVANTLTNIAK